MADHIRKVSAGTHGNQYHRKIQEKNPKSGKNRGQDSEKWGFYFEIVTEGFVKFMNEIWYSTTVVWLFFLLSVLYEKLDSLKQRKNCDMSA